MNISDKTGVAFVTTTFSAEETVELGRKIGALLRPGDVVALTGSLGSGKTTLVKGLASGLGIRDPREVRSASFLLIAEYKARIPIYHFDAYRLKGASQMYELGCDEIFWGDGVSVVEWADRVEECLPEDYLGIRMTIEGTTARRIEVSSHGRKYDEIVEGLMGRGP